MIPEKQISKAQSPAAPVKVETGRPLGAKAQGPAEPGTPVRVPPFFRPIDWLTFGLTTLLVFIGYLLTMGCDLSLQDSGELAVGSYYAGVPHPPGYPIWTIVTYLFTLLVPISNIAFRVGLSAAVAGAMTCGLIGLLVSRGSSMFLEGIEQFKGIERSKENAICAVSGFVAGALIGFNGFMWSQSLIVEVYPLSALSLMGVMVFLFRWLYAPHQHRYLYVAWFLCGVAFNNHQSLLVITMCMEVLVAAVQPKLGRDMFLGNFICYVIGLILWHYGVITTLNDNASVQVIYHLIGVASLLAFLWLWIQTREVGTALLWGIWCGLAFTVGAAFYVFMPITSMTNPPMNWGYARTVQGFFHAFTRGQYERIHPTAELGRYIDQLGMLVAWGVEEFNVITILFALVPFFFIRQMARRERSLSIGLIAFYVILGPFLLLLLNPAPDRQSQSLNKVFVVPFQAFVAMGVGYGLTFVAAMLVQQYERFRRWILYAFALSAAFALYNLNSTWETTPYVVLRWAAISGFAMALVATLLLILARNRAPLAGLLLVFTALPSYPILNHWSENEQHGHLFGFWFGHDMFTPPFTAPDGKLSYDPKLRAEVMKDPVKAKLTYPEMDRDTVLFGGTDPGRFCPTYMIFCESFIPPEKRRDTNFDRRDVYIITQNALADGTYLNYIRAHYFRSAQIDPPFFSELVRGEREKEANVRTNLLARMMLPLDHLFLGLGDRIEKNRRVGSSFFTESDFTDLAGLATKLKSAAKPSELSQYLRDSLSPETRKLLEGQPGPALAHALAKDFNRLLDDDYEANRRIPELREELEALPDSATSRKQELTKQIAEWSKKTPFYETNRFRDLELTDKLNRFSQQVAAHPQLHSRVRFSRLLLEAAYPKEIATSLSGVYPDLEIYTPSNEDSQRCFSEYMADAQERMKKGQLKPGEDVRTVDNKVQVSGQVAVMSINGLLTKVIFEHNPHNEFYVEESFPLDWMYPHLTPYGIIMKINRNPLPELTQEVLDRDHYFWSQYSERLIGNWITYETPISNICAFATNIYVRHDYSKFKGDPKFIRDDDGQKAFSKLRSSIAGIYAWRIDHPSSPAEQARVMREAEFAFKQAYAFCPYSPEALYRYVNLLIRAGRIDDARMLATASKQLDPHNAALDNLINELDRFKHQPPPTAAAPPPSPELARMEALFRADPLNFTNTVALAQGLAQSGQQPRVIQIADTLIGNPKADGNAVYLAVQIYGQLRVLPKLETALVKWVTLNPTPEAYMDLAGTQAALSKSTQALTSLRTALDMNDQRLAKDPKASNLALSLPTDDRFGPLRALPDFRQLMAPKK